MASPYTLLMTEDQEVAYDAGVVDGRVAERERIIKNIQSRVTDLRACSKVDNCRQLADLIESYIPEWTEGENK